MALLPILRYPDPRLHKVAARVERVDDKIRKLIKDMADTMYAAPGVGLAATQVDVHQRVIVIDISETHDQLRVFVNPEIVAASGAVGLRGRLPVGAGRVRESARAPSASRCARSMPRASEFTLEAEGLLAVCIQHEMDHLEGKVFVEKLSRLKQNRILARLKKQERRAAEPDARRLAL